MVYVRVLLVAVFAGGIALGGLALAQDTKKSSEPTARLRGQLPQNWSKLGMSEDQKQKTYAIQGKYDKEIDVLQAQIRDLRAKEKTELDGVLTAEQKKRLREIITEKTPGASDKPEKQ